MDYLRDCAKANVPKEALAERVIDSTLRAEQRAELRAKAEKQGAAAWRRTERGAADGSLLWRITDLCDNRVSRARAHAQHTGKRCLQEGRKHRHTDTPTDPTKGRTVC